MALTKEIQPEAISNRHVSDGQPDDVESAESATRGFDVPWTIIDIHAVADYLKAHPEMIIASKPEPGGGMTFCVTSERKNLKELPSSAESMLIDFFDKFKFDVCIKGKDGIFRYVNMAFAEHAGEDFDGNPYSKEMIIGRDDSLIHPIQVQIEFTGQDKTIIASADSVDPVIDTKQQRPIFHAGRVVEVQQIHVYKQPIFWKGETCVLIYFSDETKEINRINELISSLHQAYEGFFEGLVDLLDQRDEETSGHSQRVKQLTVELAKTMGIKEEELDDIERGALLHDIGKVVIPDEILKKRGQLTDDDWKTIRKHPVTASELLDHIKWKSGPAHDIPKHHHERFDGQGYPDGLVGDMIPLAARMFSVVDVWDALAHERPYRRNRWDWKKIKTYLKEESSKQFDPKVVDAFIEMMEKRQEEILI